MIGYTCSSSILLTHSNLHWSVSHNTNRFLLVYFGHVFASPEVEAAVDHPFGDRQIALPKPWLESFAHQRRSLIAYLLSRTRELQLQRVAMQSWIARK